MHHSYTRGFGQPEMIRIVKTQFLVATMFRRYLPAMTNSIERFGGGAGGG